jgi:hypothetical protein
MKKPPKKPELKVRADVTQQYFAAKRMERAGLLRPGTALMLYSGTTPRTTLPARSYFGRMPVQKKQTRGGGQGGAPALQSGGGGGLPPWLPTGATTFTDFKNGHYYANGAEVAAADVISNPAQISGGTGLTLVAGQAAQTFLGDALTGLSAISGTIVAEFLTPNPKEFLLVCNNNEDSNERWVIDAIEANIALAIRYDDANYDEADTGNSSNDGRNIVAINYSASGSIVISMNGGAFVDGGSTVTNAAATQIVFGQYHSGGTVNAGRDVTLVSLTRYPLRPNSDLPTLSALS